MPTLADTTLRLLGQEPLAGVMPGIALPDAARAGAARPAAGVALPGVLRGRPLRGTVVFFAILLPYAWRRSKSCMKAHSASTPAARSHR